MEWLLASSWSEEAPKGCLAMPPYLQESPSNWCEIAYHPLERV